MNSRILLISFVLVFGSLCASSMDTTWVHKKHNEGIEVYTRKMPGSSVYQLKIKTLVPASLKTVVAVLDDVESYHEWVYKCEDPRILEKKSDYQYVYCVHSDFPFPVSDRDVVIEYILDQDPKTKVVTTVSKAVPDYTPRKKGVVRISKFNSQYTIKPISASETAVEYWLDTSPGGAIPSWLVNLGIAKGPSETMKGLIQQVKKERYQVVDIPYISE